MSDPGVEVFFYGSYMSPDVLREAGLVPRRLEVARLPGYRLTIGPLANVVRADGETVHGALAVLTHGELERLYAHARDVLGGTYLPWPVLVHTGDGRAVPALCYVAHDLTDGRPAASYVARVVAAARAHGLPEEYIRHIESFGAPRR